MQIATSKTRDQFPLSRKKIYKKTIGSMVGWTVLSVFVYTPFVIVAWPISKATSINLTILVVGYILVGLLIYLLVFAANFVYQTWYFDTYFYDFTDQFVVIKKGVFASREISIPYERIQDVYVDQDIFDRILHLYDVHLSTATATSGMEAHIDGVENQAADGLRQYLTTTISVKIKNVNAPQPQTYGTPAPNQPAQ